ncbi:MAG: hypothetical protein QOF01_4032, partial [Thermomicrobiales bacterium]|nr:hypothetical protein [Thermomicrobiales bacterium]
EAMSMTTPGPVGPPDAMPPAALAPRSIPPAVAAHAAQSPLGSGSLGQAVTIDALLASGSSAPKGGRARPRHRAGGCADGQVEDRLARRGDAPDPAQHVEGGHRAAVLLAPELDADCDQDHRDDDGDEGKDPDRDAADHEGGGGDASDIQPDLEREETGRRIAVVRRSLPLDGAGGMPRGVGQRGGIAGGVGVAVVALGARRVGLDAVALEEAAGAGGVVPRRNRARTRLRWLRAGGWFVGFGPSRPGLRPPEHEVCGQVLAVKGTGAAGGVTPREVARGEGRRPHRHRVGRPSAAHDVPRRRWELA